MPLRAGANQLESYGDIGGLLLGEFNLGQTGACGIDCFGTGQKKGEQALLVAQRQCPDLNLDDGVGELRVLLLLLP